MGLRLSHLLDQPNIGPEPIQIQVFDVLAIQLDHALRWSVPSLQETNNCAFTRAARTNYSCSPFGWNGQCEFVENRDAWSGGVCEANVLHLNLPAALVRLGATWEQRIDLGVSVDNPKQLIRRSCCLGNLDNLRGNLRECLSSDDDSEYNPASELLASVELVAELR